MSDGSLAARMKTVLATKRRADGSLWDAKALSLAAGLGTSHVGQIAAGKLKNPSLRTLTAIARAAGVSAAWLATGTGSMDASDPTEPSVSDSDEPIHGNVIGWEDVLREDQREHPSMEMRYWNAATQSAPFLLNGPALPGDALRLARLAQELSDPTRLARALRDAQARVKLLEAQQQGKADAFHAKVRGGGTKP